MVPDLSLADYCKVAGVQAMKAVALKRNRLRRLDLSFSAAFVGSAARPAAGLCSHAPLAPGRLRLAEQPPMESQLPL